MEKSYVTQKELEQLYWLNREIEADRKRVSELECMLRYGGAATGLPLMSAEERGGVREELEECCRILSKRVKRAAAEYRRLCVFIDGIEDSMMRQILSLRYINGLSWQQVAFSIGEGDEQVPRRRHNAFMKKLPKTKS